MIKKRRKALVITLAIFLMVAYYFLQLNWISITNEIKGMGAVLVEG
jgi:hypothetical protein